MQKRIKSRRIREKQIIFWWKHVTKGIKNTKEEKETKAKEENPIKCKMEKNKKDKKETKERWKQKQKKRGKIHIKEHRLTATERNKLMKSERIKKQERGTGEIMSDGDDNERKIESKGRRKRRGSKKWKWKI